MSVKRRLVGMFFAGGFGQAITLLNQILGNGLLSRVWTKGLVADWSVLNSLPSAFAVSDFSIATAAANEMAIAEAQGRREDTIRLLHSSWAFVTIVTLVLFLLLSPIAFLIDFRSWLNLEESANREAQITTVLLLASALLNLQGGPLLAMYRCVEKGARGLFFQNLNRLAEFGAFLIGLLLGQSMIVISLLILVGRVVAMGFNVWDASRCAPHLKLGFRHASFATIKELLGPALAFMGYPVANALMFGVLVSAISAQLGTAAALLFTTIRTMARVIAQVSGTIGNSLWYEFSTAMAKDDFELARKLHRTGVALSVWFSLVACPLMALVGPWLYKVWLNKILVFDPVVAGWLLASVGINSVWSASAAVQVAVNKHQRLVAWVLGVSLVTVGAVSFGGEWLGVGGIAALLAIGELVLLVAVMPRSLQMVKETPKGLMLATLRAPLRLLGRAKSAGADGG